MCVFSAQMENNSWKFIGAVADEVERATGLLKVLPLEFCNVVSCFVEFAVQSCPVKA